jgi:putative photosynthetic complex assembly protein 2
VRNRGEEFLPPHLLYIGSYFRRRRFNALMPLSVLAGCAVAVALIASAMDTSGAERTGLLLVASLLVLALIEHVLLVAPLPPTLLWRWALRTAPSTP